MERRSKKREQLNNSTLNIGEGTKNAVSQSESAINNTVSITKRLLITIIFAVSSALFLNQLITISGLIDFSAGFKASSEAIFDRSRFELLLLSGVVAPLVEEMIFRGLIFFLTRYLCKQVFTNNRKAFICAALLSSILFGLYHGNIVQFIYAFIMGMFMCLICEYLYGLLGSIIFHVSANMFIIFCTGVSVLGTAAGQIISIVISGIIMLISLHFILKSVKI